MGGSEMVERQGRSGKTVGWDKGLCIVVDSCLGPTGLRNKRVCGGSCLFTTMGNSASLCEGTM